MESESQARSPGGTLAQDPAPVEDGKAPATEEGSAAAAPQDVVLSGGSSSTPAEEGPGKTLVHADELFEKGSKAIEDGDFVNAVDCLSRALEIRVSHYGELAQECASSYYKYGCALLYKAQEEADPLGNFPKIPPKTEEKSKTSICIEENESSKASADASEDASLVDNEVPEEREHGKDSINDEVDEESGDEEDTTEVDEDESDLDLAWKMLDVARAIVEKHPGDTMEKVNILSALAEVSMEREDIETSLNDYLKALSILEHLVELDHRRIIELNFRVSLVLELGSRVSDAIPYCEKAISLCKSRLVRLRENGTGSTSQTGASGSSVSDSEKGVASNVAEEMELLSGFSTELEKKLEDLQQIIANPRSVISDVMKLIASKQISNGNNAQSTSSSSSFNSSQMATTNGPFDSPTISTPATNGVVDLGVVGRGVKRATIRSIGDESSSKKPMLDKPSEEADHS